MSALGIATAGKGEVDLGHFWGLEEGRQGRQEVQRALEVGEDGLRKEADQTRAEERGWGEKGRAGADGCCNLFESRRCPGLQKVQEEGSQGGAFLSGLTQVLGKLIQKVLERVPQDTGLRAAVAGRHVFI